MTKIAQMLAETGDYGVTVIDRSAEALASIAGLAGVATRTIDVTDAGALDAVLAGAFAVLSAAPFHLTGSTLTSESSSPTATTDGARCGPAAPRTGSLAASSQPLSAASFNPVLPWRAPGP